MEEQSLKEQVLVSAAHSLPTLGRYTTPFRDDYSYEIKVSSTRSSLLHCDDIQSAVLKTAPGLLDRSSATRIRTLSATPAHFDRSVSFAMALPSAAILSMSAFPRSGTIHKDASLPGTTDVMAMSLGDLTEELQTADELAGPAVASDIEAILSWYRSIVQSLSRLNSTARTMMSFVPSDVCGLTSPHTGCCHGHNVHQAALSSIRELTDLLDMRELNIDRTTGAITAPSGSKYPYFPTQSQRDDRTAGRYPIAALPRAVMSQKDALDMISPLLPPNSDPRDLNKDSLREIEELSERILLPARRVAEVVAVYADLEMRHNT